MGILSQIKVSQNATSDQTEVTAKKLRKKRLDKKLAASTQNTIAYTSLFENGLMHIARDVSLKTEEIYSRTYRLGEASYGTASEAMKLGIVGSYEEALNSLDVANQYQLLLHNRPVGEEVLEGQLFYEEDDEFDKWRKEYNQSILERFNTTQSAFQTDKYITISTTARDKKHAERQLNDVQNIFEDSFAQNNISFSSLEAKKRMEVLASVLRPGQFLEFSYSDIALVEPGYNSRNFIAPGSLDFSERDHFRLDDKHAQVVFLRDYPNVLQDKLISDIMSVDAELFLSIHVKPYAPDQAIKKINSKRMTIEEDMIKQVKQGNRDFLSEDLAVGKKTQQAKKAADKWAKEVLEHDQQVFHGLITIMVLGDSIDELKDNLEQVEKATRKQLVSTAKMPYHQEQALNTILPIGINYLGFWSPYNRDFTSSNISTQVPFTNVDLASTSPKALNYGLNQISKNLISLDRKEDLNTGSGIVVGGSGSGKSFSVKHMEIIPTFLKYTNDRLVILDPEGEYVKLGESFGAQIIDIEPGASTRLNLLDLPKGESKYDPIAQKADLLLGIFETLFGDVSDTDLTLIDRVTKEVYNAHNQPTLKEWYDTMKSQPEKEEAEKFCLKLEPYVFGSQNIFAHPTNVDLNNRFIIFNLKNMNEQGKLKVFAMLVIEDFLWNILLENQDKFTTRFYFDELQIYFRQGERVAGFFTNLWARIRKYGGITTGITQYPGTILENEEFGKPMFANTEFLILLKLNDEGLDMIVDTLKLSENLVRYIESPKTKGSGLIKAGNTIVPFMNTVPRDTKLFELIDTSAKSEDER